MLVKFEKIPCIKCEYIQTLIGAPWNKCAFGQLAENGSFQCIYTDDESLYTCEDNVEYAREHRPENDYILANNELNLVKALRTLGYTDKVLVEVEW